MPASPRQPLSDLLPFQPVPNAPGSSLLLRPSAWVQVGAHEDQVFLHGMDKAGRPLMTVTAGAFVVADRNVEECTLGVCSILDHAVEQARSRELTAPPAPAGQLGKSLHGQAPRGVRDLTQGGRP